MSEGAARDVHGRAVEPRDQIPFASPILAALALAAVSCASLVERGADARLEVLDVETRRVQALPKNDVGALREIFADDLIYVHASGRAQSKEEYLALMEKGELRYVMTRYEQRPVVRIFGDVAVINGRLQVSAQLKSGPPTQRLVASLTVYARIGEKWRLVSLQNTLIPPR